MSSAGGVHLALERGEALRCEAIQLFVRPNNRWQARPFPEGEVEAFREGSARGKVQATLAHGCYLVNLASPDPALRKRSMGVTREELERCSELGIPQLVIHPGSHMEAGEKAGIRRIARALDMIRESAEAPSVTLLLETTAGQGTSIGCRFEHLRDILAAVKDASRLGICLDTCHLFASGWDVRTEEGYGEMREALDEMVGLERVGAVHVNDSKRECGSRVDRHQHIGEGEIGREGFRWFLNDPALGGLPFVLETPKGDDDRADRRNLGRLRRLIVGGKKPGKMSTR